MTMDFDNDFLAKLLEQAKENPRLRQHVDLRTSPADGSQRMLNALQPGTEVPVHRHEESSETVVCLKGKLYEVIYEEVNAFTSAASSDFERGMDAQSVATGRRFPEGQRILLCPVEGHFGCQLPKGAWHTVEVIEPSVILESKDGAYVG